jgi:hypothetical protein
MLVLYLIFPALLLVQPSYALNLNLKLECCQVANLDLTTNFKT